MSDCETDGDREWVDTHLPLNVRCSAGSLLWSQLEEDIPMAERPEVKRAIGTRIVETNEVSVHMKE